MGKFRSFKEAKEFVRHLDLESSTDYRRYARSGKRPDDIPANPQLQYKGRGWIDWPDFLSTQKKKGHDKTGRFTTKNWLPFKQARAKVRSRGLKSFIEFKNYWARDVSAIRKSLL